MKGKILKKLKKERLNKDEDGARKEISWQFKDIKRLNFVPLVKMIIVYWKDIHYRACFLVIIVLVFWS